MLDRVVVRSGYVGRSDSEECLLDRVVVGSFFPQVF
jgi:hypothetical protein